MPGSESPICYLDLDDTLIRHVAEHPDGIAAPGAADFLRFLLEHFEVRWLTMWCPAGVMTEESLDRLHRLFGLSVEELRGIHNPRAFTCGTVCPFKHQGVDFAEAERGRPFVWIEDHLNGYDREELEARGYASCYVECDVTREPRRLRTVMALLAERFDLDVAGEPGVAMAASGS